MSKKLWLVGMIRGDRSILEKTITPIIQYFDGVIFVCDSRAKEEDVKWLESIKGEGKIILKKWVNDHAHTSNEIFFSGVANDGDYMVFIDETDQIRDFFAKNIREYTGVWNKNNVGMVYLDHPFIFRFHDGLRFVGNPHWGIANVLGATINLSEIPGYRKENYIINNRELLRSAFLNPCKYWISYPNFSNHTQLLYAQFGNEIHSAHENLRINFRNHLKHDLGVDISSIDNVIRYLQDNYGRYTEFVEQAIEIEIAMKDIFRLYVVGNTIQDLIDNRWNWSYFVYKNEGVTKQGKFDGYVGLFNQYRLKQGKEME